MIKGVSFDCFGVLLEDSWLAFMEQYSDAPGAFEALRDINQKVDRGEASYDEFLEKVAGIGHVSKQEAWKIIQKGHHLNHDLHAFIQQLKAKYKLGILSNVGQPLKNYIPDEWIDDFEVQTLSYVVGAIKPDQLIYKAHIEAMGLEPSEIVFIDDRLPNCEAAREAGMQAIAYSTLPALEDELAKLGVHV